MKLFDLGFEPEEVISHPRHQAAQVDLVPLIERVRSCRSPQDGYELQQDLLRHLLEVEEHRNAFSKAVKRMRAGKVPQAGAPEPQSGLHLSDIETWIFERELCERIARQFRSIGDALAWRAFNHDRKYILALCRNAAPGIMAGKARPGDGAGDRGGALARRRPVRTHARPDQLPPDRRHHGLAGRRTAHL